MAAAKERGPIRPVLDRSSSAGVAARDGLVRRSIRRLLPGVENSVAIAATCALSLRPFSGDNTIAAVHPRPRVDLESIAIDRATCRDPAMWLSRASLRYFYLGRLSRPAIDRPIYRLIRRHRLRRIVELGVGPGERSLRMIEMAAAGSSTESVVYTGVDLFEMRTPQDGPGLSLKQIHRKLAASGAKIRLLPGDPHAALSRSVNMLGTADLVVISADQQSAAIERSWYFVERLLQANSLVLIEVPGSDKAPGQFRTVPHDEIRRHATATTQRRRAA